MTCNCQNCGWPVHTKRKAVYDCPRCQSKIDCTGEEKPLPPAEWPAWAKAIKKFAKSKDTGVGDTVQRIAASFGGEFLKSFAKTIGMPCGCTERQKDWNARYPYDFRGYTPVPTDPTPNPQRPRLIITVATGEEHERLVEVSGPAMKAYADTVNADFLVLTGTTQPWWGLEKFRICPYVEAYERTMFLDADVLVRDGSPDIFELVPVGHVGMHDDATMISQLWSIRHREELCESQGVPAWLPPTMRNTGVVVCDRMHADIWTPPRLPIPEHHCDEQFWIERWTRYYWNFHLPPEFNTQWYWKDFMERAKSAWFVHLANCPASERRDLMLWFMQGGNKREVDR